MTNVFSIEIAIDFGTSLLKSSIIDSINSPYVATNFDTKRSTPHVIAFRSTPQFNSSKTKIDLENAKHLHLSIGEEAEQLRLKRPWMGAGYFPLFYDKNDTYISQISSAFHIQPTAAGISFSDLNSLFLHKYIHSISAGKTVIGASAIVPATATLTQRRFIQDYIRSAGTTPMEAIDDADAISCIYAVEKTAKYYRKPHRVLFIDVGAASVKAYVVQFSLERVDNKTARPHADRLSYAINRSAGGAYVTAALAQQFPYKPETPGETSRFLDAAEKLKVKLSLIRRASVFVEDIGGDDVSVTLSREDVETASRPLADAVISTAQEALITARANSHLISNITLFTSNITSTETSNSPSNNTSNETQNNDIDEIELIGGSSRLTIIQSALSEVFTVPIRRSLNADDALSTGGGYASQFLHGSSKFAKVIISNHQPLRDAFLVAGNLSTLSDSVPFRQSGDPLFISPITNITYSYSNGWLSAAEVPNTSTSLSAFGVEYSSELHSEGHKSLRTLYSIFRRPNSTLYLSFSNHPCSIARIISLHNGSISDVKLYPHEREQTTSIYNAILAAEDARRKLGRSRNDLEQFSLRVLSDSESNETFKLFAGPFLQKINKTAFEIKQWSFEKADDVTDPANFTRMKSKLRDLVQPVYNRIEENRTLAIEFSKIMRMMSTVNYTINVEIPANYSYINNSLIDNFTELFNETAAWMEIQMEKALAIKPWEKLPVSGKEIKQKGQKVADEFRKLMGTPKPDWLKDKSEELKKSISKGVEQFKASSFGKKAMGFLSKLGKKLRDNKKNNNSSNKDL